MPLDFTMAKIKHASWKLKLRDFLDGKPGLTPAQATSHKDCDLGKWLYSEGLTKFGTIPEMRTLEREHEGLHKLIKTIMDLKTAGKIKQAEEEYKKIDPVSKKIVELLGTLEERTNKQAA
jgi:methyl-accepting chemotaxis protein